MFSFKHVYCHLVNDQMMLLILNKNWSLGGVGVLIKDYKLVGVEIKLFVASLACQFDFFFFL